MPAMRLSSVLFPHPEAPTRQTNSPSATVNDTSSRAVMADRPSPYVFETRCTSTAVARGTAVRRGSDEEGRTVTT